LRLINCCQSKLLHTGYFIGNKQIWFTCNYSQIVRPGGMERPTNSYKETHNLTLSTEDTLFGGQVSNLQVAELMAVMANNPDLAYCKIVEV
ncbi:hypothetical protein S83_052328, partial [Arachis hypogaea]